MAANGTEAQPGGGARSALLLDALAGVPANMAPVIAQYLGELDAGAAASVSKKTPARAARATVMPGPRLSTLA